MRHFTPLILCLALVGVAQAQQAQRLTGSPPAWVDLGSGNNFDNNDATAGNGPLLGVGTGSQGTYMTWSVDGQQYRVLKSACTEQQWDVWANLNGHHIELTMEDGVITDVHDDV